MKRPVGVTIIGGYFLLGALYSWFYGIAALISRGTFELPLYAPFAIELEYYGPYYALLAAAGLAAVAWGLFKIQRWARWAAMLGMVLIVWQLMVPISMTKTERGLFWYGILIALHAAVGFYLAQSGDVLDAFEKK